MHSVVDPAGDATAAAVIVAPPAQQREQDYAEPLVEDVEHKLELAHVTTDMMPIWASIENNMISILISGGQRLTPSIRQLALLGISEVVSCLKLPEAMWFHGMALLDTWLATHNSSTPSSDIIGGLPAACVAVAQVLRKIESGKSVSKSLRLDAADRICTAMRMCGCHLPDVLLQDVQEKEQSLLRCLGGQVTTVSLESWLSLLEARFHVLTADFYVELMIEAADRMRDQARVLVHWMPADGHRRPQHLATGLLGTGLVCAKLLPLEPLRPQHVTQDAWGQLFRESQLLEDMLACTLQPWLWRQVLESLATAANISMDQLQQDCTFTMECLRTAMDDAKLKPNQAYKP
mmetsp:Transcript_114177/g.285640  ORF Transcript_114177/g.285640 Transcript_114177/m.285640 type:complete len:348 (-) Transcript_114177:308-1351(-)